MFLHIILYWKKSPHSPKCYIHFWDVGGCLSISEFCQRARAYQARTELFSSGNENAPRRCNTF